MSNDRSGEKGNPPGVVVDHIPAESGKYIGSPSIAILSNGDYVASHDIFGPQSTYETSAKTKVFRSSEAGREWEELATLEGQLWSTLFFHEGALYIFGTDSRFGSAIIRRSDDGGETWSEPGDEKSGLILNDGDYHTAPVPAIVHRGRIWRAMEDMYPDISWPANFRAFALSAPADADLLDADSWRVSDRLSFKSSWFEEGDRPGWLEGNMVVTPQGDLVDVLRVNSEPEYGKAAIVRISEDGRDSSFDPYLLLEGQKASRSGFVDFPGGMSKFTIRYDDTSGRYWSLVNEVKGTNNPHARNVLSLTSSEDLVKWKVESRILTHPDEENHAFQYVDWLFEGEDIVAVSRTAYADGLGGAHNYHDANYLTFHRIKDFRSI